MEESEELTPISDEALDELVAAMRQKALATDQRILVTSGLRGRSLTCRQAGALLESVKLGLMQRMIAFEVLHGRLTDMPEGLESVLEPLSGSIRRDVEIGLISPRDHSYSSALNNWRHNVSPDRDNFVAALSAVDSSASSAKAAPGGSTSTTGMKDQSIAFLEGRSVSSSQIVPKKISDCEACIDRLRWHVQNAGVSEALYQDLAAAFEALGLGPLKPPGNGSGKFFVAPPPSTHQKPPSMAPPVLLSRLSTNNGGAVTSAYIAGSSSSSAPAAANQADSQEPDSPKSHISEESV